MEQVAPVLAMEILLQVVVQMGFRAQLQLMETLQQLGIPTEPVAQVHLMEVSHQPDALMERRVVLALTVVPPLQESMEMQSHVPMVA
jgi:hypothetical protein